MCDECTENAWVDSAEDERERIVKLLQEPKWHLSVYAPRLSTEEPRIECASECLCCHLIALIKEEN